MFKPNRDEWYAIALAACQKKYGKGVDTKFVERAVDYLQDMFSDDDDVRIKASGMVRRYISYTVAKYDKSSFPVEKLAIEAIVGKKLSGNYDARAVALADWVRVQEGKDACDENHPSPMPTTKNKIGKVVTAYINQARKDKRNNCAMTKYAFRADGYTMYARLSVAVRTKEDWGLDKAAFTSGVVAPTTDVWANIDAQPSVAVRVDRYQVEVFADVGLQVDFKVSENLSIYLNAKDMMFLFKVLQADSLVFYTPRAKTIEGAHPCYYGSVWYCQNEHGQAVFMPVKHDMNEHPIVCDISKQVQVINGKEVVTMAKTTKVEKVEEVKQTTKEDKGMSKTITTADGEKIPAKKAETTTKVKATTKTTAKTPDTMTNAELNAQPGVHAEYLAKPTKKTTAKKSTKVEAPTTTPQPSQFAGLTTMEQVRQRYMELIQQGVEPSIELVRQYTIAFMSAHEAELKAAQDSGKYIGKLLKEQSPTEGYLEAINVALQLAKNNGVEVKVEGCYIWISNTKREDMECRNALKGAGFWWARNRKQWYWRPAFLYKKEA